MFNIRTGEKIVLRERWEQLKIKYQKGGFLKMYQARKTIQKTIAPPTVIIAGSAAVSAVLHEMDIKVEHEVILQLAICAWGVLRGFVNWIKHRRG